MSSGIHGAKSHFTKLGLVEDGDEIFFCVCGSLLKKAQVQEAEIPSLNSLFLRD